jgi:hypothetical protein
MQFTHYALHITLETEVNRNAKSPTQSAEEIRTR